MLRSLLAASASAWILAAAGSGTVKAQTDGELVIRPIEAAVAPSRAGSEQAVTAKVAIGTADYLLYLDPAAGIATTVPTQGTEASGTPLHVVPTRATVSDGAVTIDLLVNKRPRQVRIPLDAPAGRTPGRAPSGPAAAPAPITAPTPPVAPASAANEVLLPPELPRRRRAQLEKVNIHNLQASLTALGFDAGAADGSWGPKSREALRTFRAEQGLPDREEPSHGDLAALQRALAALRSGTTGEPAQAQATSSAPEPAPQARLDPLGGARQDGSAASAPHKTVAVSDAELATLLQSLKIDPDAEGGDMVIRFSDKGGKTGSGKSQMAVDLLKPEGAPRTNVATAAADGPVEAAANSTPPASEPAGPAAAKRLDFADWTARPFLEETRRAVQTMAEAPEKQGEALSRLAGVYLAHGRVEDAKALVSDLRRRGEATPLLAALAEATAALEGQALPEAGLFQGKAPEARLWRAVDALYRGDADGTAPLASLKPALADIPEALRFRIARDAIGRLVEASRFTPAHDVMRMLEAWSADPETADLLDYWRAREFGIRGDQDKAKALYERLAQGRGELGVRARFHLAALSLPDAGPAAASDIADQLDRLAATWPDARLDPSYNRLSIGALRKASRTAEAASKLDRLLRDPDPAVAGWARDEMHGLLDSLLKGSEPASLPARLALLSLSNRWAARDPSLRPIQAEAAEFLARNGLTKRAAEMLAEAEATASPAEKPALVMRRAALQMLAGEPKAAAVTLRGIATLLPQSSPLHADWLARMADALTLSGKPLEALALLDEEKGSSASPKVAEAAMRAHIAAERWDWVATQLSQDVPPTPELAADRLGESDLQDEVLRLASVYALAGQEEKLEAFARAWRPVMDSTRHAGAFAALTDRTPASTVRDLLASADRLLDAKLR